MGPLYCRERLLFVNFNVILNLNVHYFELENNDMLRYATINSP